MAGVFDDAVNEIRIDHADAGSTSTTQLPPHSSEMSFVHSA
jgi:hypothetical protein